MYFNKLLLKDFGKFNNKEIELRTGINLIHGDKGSGKSTIKSFIMGMLYGVDRTKGIGESDYEANKPEGKRGYSGKAYAQVNNNKYFIERTFSRNGRKMDVMDVKSGREVRTACKDSLHATFFQMDKSAYKDTMCIDAPKGESSKEIGAELTSYIRSMTTSGSTDVDSHKIFDVLKEERGKYDSRPILKEMDKVTDAISEYDALDEELLDVREKIKTLDEEFSMEAARRKRKARQMVEDENGEVTYKEDYKLNSKLDVITKRQMLLDAYDDETEEEEDKPKLTDRVWFILLTGIFVVAVIGVLVNILGFEKGVRQLFIICTAIFVVITIIEGLYEKGVFEDDISTPSDEEFQKIIAELEEKTGTLTEDADLDMSFADEYAKKKSVLKAREKELLAELSGREELNACLEELKAKKANCDKERRALTLAMETIKSIADDIKEESAALLSDNASDILDKLTSGRCKSVSYDSKKKQLVVFSEGINKTIGELDLPLAKKVYLAIKLAAAKFYCKGKLPVIIDEAIVDYDKTFLFDFVECLNTIDTEQIILLTSDEAMSDTLNDINIQFNYVTI